MGNNVRDPGGFHEASVGPHLWIVDAEIGRRRLIRRGANLQVDQGLARLVEPDVPTIPISTIREVEILAPYAAPSPRLAIALGGVAAGLAMSGSGSAQLYAVVVTAFAVVAAMVSAATPPGQSLARFTTGDGASHCFAFRNEDEHYVRAIVPDAAWRNGRDRIARTMLDPDQVRQLDHTRIGIVLAASAIGLVAMMYLSIGADGDDAGAFASRIIRYAAFGIVGIVNVVAWGKITMAYVSARRANRLGPRA